MCCGDTKCVIISIIVIFYVIPMSLGIAQYTKFLYMTNAKTPEGQPLYGSSEEILQSAKFWEPEELFWGIGIPMGIAMGAFFLLCIFLFALFYSILKEATNTCLEHTCPNCYYACCLNQEQRLIRDVHHHILPNPRSPVVLEMDEK